MNVKAREAIELHMLASLARSQRALCRLIETVADHAEASEQLPQRLAENMDMISRYQRTMIEKLTRLHPRKRSSSKPAAPWISSGVTAFTNNDFSRKRRQSSWTGSCGYGGCAKRL